MVTGFITVATIAALFFGYILFSKNWRDNSRLEHQYSGFFNDITSSTEFVREKGKRERLVIVQTDGRYELLRTLAKKALFWVRGVRDSQVIYVFHMDTLEEKEAFLITQIIAEEWNELETLDTTFLESMISYFAYKYACEKAGVSEAVKVLLRREYESCRFRDCITKLDDPEYESAVVINEPPTKKPMLHDIILPLAVDQNNNARNMEFARKEELKNRIMDLIKEICSGYCGILFIGDLRVNEYITMLANNFNRYRCFLLSARGNQIASLDKVLDGFSNARYRPISCDTVWFDGTYCFRQEVRPDIRYKYMLVIKKLQRF